MDIGNKIITLVIGLTIGFAVLVSAFLPNLATWTDAISDVNGVDYGWVVGIIAILVIYMFINYALVSVKGKK
jgi:amino acid transporter